MKARRYLFTYEKLDFLTQEVDGQTFCFSKPLHDEELVQNIARNGVHDPLILRGREKGCPVLLLSGHKRLHAVMHLGLKDALPVLVIPHAELSLFEALQLVISERQSQKPYNVIELARILKMAQKTLNLGKEMILKEVFPLLGLEKNPKSYETYLELTDLPETIQDFIIARKLTLKSAGLFASLYKDYSNAFQFILPLLTRFPFGNNKVHEILTNLQTIAKREQRDLADVMEEILASPEVYSSLTLTNKDLPYKANVFRTAIRRRAFPNLTEMEKQFDQAKKSLALPNKIDLNPPQFFEGDRYQIQFKFGSREELAQLSEKLLNCAQEKELDDMLELL